MLFLIYKLSGSFAYTEGYTGNNIISGRNWGVNITHISDIETKGNARLLSDVSSIATTMNINLILTKPGDAIQFDYTITNTSKLNAELYAITKQGLSHKDSEYIEYTITPNDDIYLHTDQNQGSVIKYGESQTFHVIIKYIDTKHEGESNLSLGSTIIYKQK